MRVISTNVGKIEAMQGSRGEKDSSLTAIYKRPIPSPVRITRDGLVGDQIGNKKYHGGPDQAVYLYGLSDYHWWKSELGREMEPGLFGENLTVDELDNAALAIGDRLRIGDVVLEITAPRIPCATLSRRVGDSTFLKKFRAAERPGPYCRVLEEGEIETGYAVEYEAYSGDRVSLLEIYRAEFAQPTDAATLHRHLAAPLAFRMRASKEKRLVAL